MPTAEQHRRAQLAAQQRRAASIRSRRRLVSIDEWKGAFRAVESLKTLAGSESWLHAVRVFHSDVTGEVELEAQVIWAGAAVSLPSHVDGVTVRVRFLDPGREAAS